MQLQVLLVLFSQMPDVQDAHRSSHLQMKEDGSTWEELDWQLLAENNERHFFFCNLTVTILLL
jgi:hypothetical protein